MGTHRREAGRARKRAGIGCTWFERDYDLEHQVVCAKLWWTQLVVGHDVADPADKFIEKLCVGHGC
jgi:hypothetical protein